MCHSKISNLKVGNCVCYKPCGIGGEPLIQNLAKYYMHDLPYSSIFIATIIIGSICAVVEDQGFSLAEYRAVAITSRKHVTKHFRVAKKVLCSMGTEGKSVPNSRSLRNIHWIYPAR